MQFLSDSKNLTKILFRIMHIIPMCMIVGFDFSHWLNGTLLNDI